jgi:hypothetical protein
VYQPTLRESCDGRTAGMFGEAAMAKPWDGVGTAAMAGTHKAQEGVTPTFYKNKILSTY